MPAEYRMIGRVDPVIGDRTAYRRVARAAIVVPVCDEHRQIRSGQPPAVAIPRQRKARTVDQLGLFGGPERDAIYGPARR